MTTFLPSREALLASPPRPLMNAATGEVSSLGDVLGAAATSESLETDYWDQEGRVRSDVLFGLADRLGADVYGPLLPDRRDVRNWMPVATKPEAALRYVLDGERSGALAEDFARSMFDKIKEMQAADHALWSDLTVNSMEALDAEVTRQRQAELQDAQATLNMGGAGASVAEFLGRGAVGMTDATSIALAPLGLGGSLGRVILSEAALGAAGEAAILPRMYDQAEKLDIPDPNAAAQIAMGAAFGGGLAGVIGGGIAGARRFGQYRAGRNQMAADGDAAGEALVREVEAALARDEPVPPASGPGVGSYVDGSESNISFVQAMMPAAIRASERTGVDPRIIIAQAIQETGWGAHAPNNNYFGIKSHGQEGGTSLATNEVINGETVRINASFRGYESLEASVDGYANFLLANPRYREMMAAGTLDDQIAALGRSGYATDPNYASSIAALAGRITIDGVRLPASASVTPRATTGGGGDIPTGTRAGYTAPDQVVSPSGTRIDVVYEVVDASLLTRASGELQPRDRTRAASGAQITQIAAELDPARLMPSAEADRGAPIIGPDNVIESGNGRVAAIQQAAPDRKAAYRAAISEAGFDIPEGIKDPVLVARRQSDLTPEARVAFVNDANTSSIARMSATEQAAQDARGLSSHTMAQYSPGKAISAPENTTFVRAFLEGMPANERAALTTAEGRLNLDGERRLKQALFARAYGAPDLIAKHTEAADPAMRSLIDALAEAAPAWSAMRADIDAGLIKPEMDLTDNLLDAVRLIGNARKTASKAGSSTAGAIDDALAQISLDGQIHPLTEALVQLFRKEVKEKTKGSKPKVITVFQVRPDREITELLTGYTNEARIVGKTDAALFGNELSSGPMEVLDAIQKETDLFAPGGPGTRPRDESLYRQPSRPAAAPSRRQAQEPLDTSQIDEQGYIDGAQSEGSIAADAQAIEDLRSQLQASAPEQAKVVEALADMKSRQPFTTVDELYVKNGDAPSLVEAAQADLSSRGRAINAQTGIEFKDPGPKVQATVEEKMTRKRYASAIQLTDTARGGFILKSTEDAEAIISAFRETGEIVDEGWSITNTGYLDRKILVRTENGVIAEVQLWIDQVFEAKKRRGHAIYTERRSGGITPERAALLREEEVSLYAASLREAGVNPSKLLGGSNTPKAPENSALNSASDATTAAVSSTSRASTGSQSPPFSSKASASPLSAENNTAGRPSQLANTIVDTSSTKVSTMRAEVKNSGDIEITTADGQTYRASEILDDLDADANVVEIINLCNPKGGA